MFAALLWYALTWVCVMQLATEKSYNAPVMLLTSLQQSCHMLTIECKTSSVIQNTGYFIPGLGEQALTQMSG